MLSVVHWLLAVTSLYGLVPTVILSRKGYQMGSKVTMAAVVGSILMHLTETKHGLDAGPLTVYSTLCLNLDRLTAVSAAVYYGYQVYSRPQLVDRHLAANMLSGLAVMIMGERTKDLLFYTLAHFSWHLLAFTSMASLAEGLP